MRRDAGRPRYVCVDERYRANWTPAAGFPVDLPPLLTYLADRLGGDVTWLKRMWIVFVMEYVAIVASLWLREAYRRYRFCWLRVTLVRMLSALLPVLPARRET